MRIGRLTGLVFVAALFFMAPAPASEVPAELPHEVSLHVAVRSPKALIESIDRFAAAASKGTATPLQPGMLTMLAFMQLPLSPDVWDMESELHFVMPANFERSESFFILNAGSFDEFVEKLADETEVEEGDTPSSRIVRLRGLGACVIADLGDGKVLLMPLSADTEQAMAVLHGWQPTVWGEGDVMIDVNLPEDWVEHTDFYEHITDTLDGLFENGMPDLDDAAEHGIQPDFARNCIRLFYRYAPVLLDELADIHGAALDIGLAGERASLVIQGKFADHSVFSELAEAASENSSAYSSLADHVGKDATALVVTAPLGDIVPNAQNRLYWFLGDILTTLFPNQAEEFLKHLLVMTSDDHRETVAATYLDGDSHYSISWQESHEAEDLLDATVGVINSLNDMIGAAMSKHEYLFRFAVDDGKTPEGDPYKIIRLAAANPEKIDELFAEVAGEEPGVAANLAALRNFHLFLAAKDGTLVAVNNTDNPERVAEAILALENEPDEKFIEQPAAAKAAETLRVTQNSISVVDVDSMTVLFLQAMLQAQDNDMGAVLDPVIARAKAEMRKSGDAAGIGFGAANGRLAVELGVSAKAVNAIVYNIEKFRNILKEELDKASSE